MARATAWHWALFLPFAIVGVVQLSTKVTGDATLDHLTKALCIPLLAAAALGVLLVARRRPAAGLLALLLLGLAFSTLGDVLIELSLAAGLGAFLVAHLAYIGLFLLAFRRRISWWALLLVPWYLALVVVLAPTTGALFVPVLVYGIALGGMAATATRGTPLTIVGGILFVVSDTVLALQLFTGLVDGPGAEVVVMLSYLAAQSLLVLGALSRLVAWPMASSSGSGPGTSRTRRSRASRSPG